MKTKKTSLKIIRSAKDDLVIIPRLNVSNFKKLDQII